MKKYLLFAVFCGVLVLSGCGNKEEDTRSLSEKAGESLGKNLTEFTTGVGSGIDEKMKIEIILSQDIQNLGISKTVAKYLVLGESKQISVYFISTKEFSGTFLIKAFDKDNQEIGRSKSNVAFSKDDAKYVNFDFVDEIDMNLVKNYEVSVIK